jgi:hypothetical protein
MTLRISTPEAEGIYQGSKWLKIQALIDGDELRSLFETLSPFWIYPLTGIVGGQPILKEFFVEEYSRWIDALKRGAPPSDAELRRLLACAFTDDPEALWLQKVSKGYLAKIGKPVVQVQAHYFSYSPVDNVFRPMSMGSESVFWGLQFSFPQIYQDPKTMELCEAGAGNLFRKIQLWAREATRATPFVVEGKRMNAPIRLGKNCFSWIQGHPQLIQRKISLWEMSHAQ